MQVFCGICLDHCAQDDRLSVITNCGHVFHTACLTRWLIENFNCPHCRIDARGNAIKNLYINAGPDSDAPSPSPGVNAALAAHEACQRACTEAANQEAADLCKINFLTMKVTLLKDEVKNYERRMNLMAQQNTLKMDQALERYKYIEKMLEDGSAEVDTRMFSGERSWQNLACVLKSRLNLLTAELRDLKCRTKTSNSNVSIAGRVNRTSMVPQVGSPIAGPSHGLSPSPAPQVAAAAVVTSSPAVAAGSPNNIGHDWSFEYSAEMFRTPIEATRRTFRWNFYFQ